ncbi:MAG TPA: FAD-dependent oxidoreductase, partial [Thermomicrobiales bacterium]|nr:FAD-dependent oxidoreductase [Thermomicrobiales bacterium]
HGQDVAKNVPIRAVFVLIGADPCTGWLRGSLALDDQGFILTGRDLAVAGATAPYQTSEPGVFAVGDVRSGSVKRVASAVGEGAVVVQGVHRALAADRAAAERQSSPAS